MPQYFTKINWAALLFLEFALVLFFALYSPLGDFRATPKFWRDEAIPFEIARTYLEEGKLDVVVAPHEVDGRPYLTHATGFPLTLPLAGFFAIFGVSVGVARSFMVIWILAVIATLFFVVRDFFGNKVALLSVLLIGTFAPFYANGRTTTGEIPGLLFLLPGLWLLYKRGWYVSSGIFIALAAITKPSIYLLLFPALIFEFLIHERGAFFRNGIRFSVGVIPVLVTWLWVIIPAPFSSASWAGLINLYRHPFPSVSILSRLPANFFEIITQTTIMYVTLLSFVVVIALWKGAFQANHRRLTFFTLFFGIFSFIYYLRSPGWLRYLLGYEILLLVLLVPALIYLFDKRKYIYVLIVGALVIVHAGNYFFFSDIQSGTKSIETADFINNEILDRDPASTIGIIYMPTVAPLIPPDRKYQISTIGGREVYGRHPLSLPENELPTYIVGFDGEYKPVLDMYYEPFLQTPGKEMLYKKKIQ